MFYFDLTTSMLLHTTLYLLTWALFRTQHPWFKGEGVEACEKPLLHLITTEITHYALLWLTTILRLHTTIYGWPVPRFMCSTLGLKARVWRRVRSCSYNDYYFSPTSRLRLYYRILLYTYWPGLCFAHSIHGLREKVLKRARSYSCMLNTTYIMTYVLFRLDYDDTTAYYFIQRLTPYPVLCTAPLVQRRRSGGVRKGGSGSCGAASDDGAVCGEEARQGVCCEGGGHNGAHITKLLEI